MNRTAWLCVLVLVVALAAWFALRAARGGRPNSTTPPDVDHGRASQPAPERPAVDRASEATANPTTPEAPGGPRFDAGHQFPDGDEDTNLQAQEAGQLIAWCAGHPQTAAQAQQLDAQLRALSTEWNETPEHLRAMSKKRYYDWTSSILHDARRLAGLPPHGNPVVD